MFQGKNVPEIVISILREHGFTDIERSLLSDYPAREYAVQYMESDFDFITRLLEDEGIYYYFKHEASRHTMVLADAMAVHEPAADSSELPFVQPDAHRRALGEYVESWKSAQRILSGVYATGDFRFDRPGADLRALAAERREHPFSDLEIYNFPGGYSDSARGEARARVRLEQAQSSRDRATGVTNARGIRVGTLVRLTGHPAQDQNTTYLITSAAYSLRAQAHRSGDSTNEAPFRCQFDALPTSRPIRARTTTVKPRILGPQTAVVTGCAGQEIWTDNYGRVKVQTTHVKKDQSVSVGASRSLSVGGSESITVGGTRTTSVKKKDKVTLAEEHELTVTGKVTETYENEHKQTITGPQHITIATSRDETVPTYTLTSDTKFLLRQGETTLEFAGGKVKLEANAEIEASAGGTIKVRHAGGMITMSAAGIMLATDKELCCDAGGTKLTIRSTGVTVETSSKVSVTAGSSSLELDDSGVEITGSPLKLN